MLTALGLIGPKRMFGPGATYSWTNWFFLIGFICPIIQYYIARRYPRSFVRYVFLPAFFGVSGMIPPATMFQLFCFCSMGLFFNWFLKSKYPGWWARYTYSLAGALDIGNALCLILFALGIGLSGAVFPAWWGNSGYSDNLDSNEMAVLRTITTANGTIDDSITSWS